MSCSLLNEHVIRRKPDTKLKFESSSKHFLSESCMPDFNLFCSTKEKNGSKYFVNFTTNQDSQRCLTVVK